jgi:competence protein ComEA
MLRADPISGHSKRSRHRILIRFPNFLGLFTIVFLGTLPGTQSQSLIADTINRKSTRLVDINHATVQELTTLPGIGKVTAQRIIEFREKNGPFHRPEELLIIRGISEKRLKQILPRIILGPDLK